MTASLIFSSERLFYNVSIPQIALGVSNSPTMAASSPLFAKRSAHDRIHIGVCESIIIKICNIIFLLEMTLPPGRHPTPLFGTFLSPVPYFQKQVSGSGHIGEYYKEVAAGEINNDHNIKFLMMFVCCLQLQ